MPVTGRFARPFLFCEPISLGKDRLRQSSHCRTRSKEAKSLLLEVSQ